MYALTQERIWCQRLYSSDECTFVGWETGSCEQEVGSN